ncbi:MAG TPA: NAD-dependent epimerase/dehydratase family protein, partial [Coriobacteriia bacterium]
MNDPVVAALRADCESAITDVAKLVELRGQRILVTGGTGFMGSWIAEMVAWLNDSHDMGVDLLLLSPSASGFADRVPHLASRSDITLIERDVRDIDELPKGVTHVIHAAGTPDNRVHVTDPLGTMSTIARGTSAVMHAAAASLALRKVLNVSSGLVYGAQALDMARMPESHAGGPDPASINAIYAEAKRYAEA